MTTATPTTSPDRTEARATANRAFWRPAGLAAVGAAAATTAVAAIARAAGVSLTIDGEAIPLAGFAQLTLMCTVLGIGLAAAMRRWARRPRRTFVVTTVVLTALSFVPDLVVLASLGTRAALITTHLVAAAIVIPVLAARLGHERN